jgi:hypothetical protein
MFSIIYIWPPLWSSGQSSWLQIRRSRVHYKNKIVGLERGPLSLVSTTEELLGKESSGSDLESREYAVGIRHADHVAPSIRKKLALTSLTSGGCSVGIVRLRIEATEFSFCYLYLFCLENRDYCRRRSAALTMRQPSIRKKLAPT